MRLDETARSRSAYARRGPKRTLEASAFAVLAAFLFACEGETLDPGPDVPGDAVALAPHTVALVSVGVPARMDDRSEMRFVVAANLREGATGGITAVGITARISSSRQGTPVTVRLVEAAIPEVPRAVTRELRIPLQQLRQQLPFAVSVSDELILQIAAHAIHSAGACVAAVVAVPQQLPCPGEDIAFPTSPAAETFRVQVVAGVTVALPGGTTDVGDLAVHHEGAQVFVSNRSGHSVDVLQLNAPGGPQFRTTPIIVGSQPWGLAVSSDRSELFVANSGGTNISIVQIASLQEVRRFEIPRAVLHEFFVSNTVCPVRWYNYTDRPQFVAQDQFGRLLYSAASSAAAPVGTIRLAERQPGWATWSARFLFPGDPAGSAVTTPSPENRGVTSGGGWAIANLDSVTVIMVQNGPFVGTNCDVILHDHVPGSFPQIKLQAGPFRLGDQEATRQAILSLSAQGSDVIAYQGFSWNLSSALPASDTTYVARSRDGRWVAFAEGVTAPNSRVTLWRADVSMSRVDDMADLMNNTSERVTAVALNADGSMGVTRGQTGAFFFDAALRLRGTFTDGIEDGAGAGLLSMPDGRTLGFFGTGRSSIAIAETQSFRSIAEIPIRSPVVGPLRVEAGGTTPGAAATVYAVTAEGVLVLPISASQLQ